jgi:hypothetical protein
LRQLATDLVSAEAAGFGFSVSGSTRLSGSSGACSAAITRTWVTSHLALVQVGASSQRTYVNWAERDLLPALRKLS